MMKVSDEIVGVVGISISYALLLFIKQFGIISLWSSLVIIVCTAMYYSYTFFKSDHQSEKVAKFLYFLLMISMIIGYFALVYKAFGIIDSSTGAIVKPGWLDATYFSVVTWSTLGYGDFRPIQELKIWVMAEALMGYIFMGLLVAKVLFFSQRSNAKDTEQMQ